MYFFVFSGNYIFFRKLIYPCISFVLCFCISLCFPLILLFFPELYFLSRVVFFPIFLYFPLLFTHFTKNFYFAIICVFLLSK
ncbi:unnamed protein product [Meloidogyne enterolobii]|uniref:Uncharacterized protein n=1 Tax=Meloidogyne enterolobii TaxID=390850 RepID=A0ACB0ZHE2_MELEN